MYLSKFELDWFAARKPYDWHTILWSAFSSEEALNPDGVDWFGAVDKLAQANNSHRRPGLFLVDDNKEKQPVTIYLVSENIPHTPTDNRLRLLGAKPYSLNISAGDYLKFKLRANPSTRVPDKADPTKFKRVYIYSEEHQKNWLTRSLRESAILNDCFVGDYQKLRFQKDKVVTTIQSVLFWGTLKVNDPLAFEKLVFKGFGREKFLGCGLMMLAKI